MELNESVIVTVSYWLDSEAVFLLTDSITTICVVKSLVWY